MPRKSKEEKQISRERIVASAADLFRKQGIEQTSVSDVMELAGMTHGGFYRHFGSKSELVVAAIAQAFRAGLDVFSADEPATARDVEAYIEQYLSDQHITEPEVGCPLPAMSASVARGEQAWKEALLAGFNEAVSKLQEGTEGYDRKDALAEMSMLVGAVSLARAFDDGGTTKDLLEAAQYHVSRLA